MARFVKSYRGGRSSAATVDGLSGSDIATDIAGRNATIQYQEDGVDIGSKGGIEYVNFTGDITAEELVAGTLIVDVTGGGGVSVITATTTWNFGDEQDEAIVTVASALLTNANLKGFTVIPSGTTATSLDDFKLNGVTFNIENIVDNTSFDIRASAINSASGAYTATYQAVYS